eukprot:8194949-Ditylum_brightwellii.AAC.1
MTPSARVANNYLFVKVGQEVRAGWWGQDTDVGTFVDMCGDDGGGFISDGVIQGGGGGWKIELVLEVFVFGGEELEVDEACVHF